MPHLHGKYYSNGILRPFLPWTLGAVALLNGVARGQAPGSFAPAGNMITPRMWHSSTLLADGRVLIAGGIDRSLANSPILASAELYDPGTGNFTPTGDMTAPRRFHTATLLANGKVLIAGGRTSGTSPAAAELYDPVAGTFSPTGEMTVAYPHLIAALLPNGKVLMAGAVQYEGRAELYDPATGTFAVTGSMVAPDITRERGDGLILGGSWPNNPILLPNGKVFIFGARSSQLYDPASETFSLTGGLIGEWKDTQTLLQNGNVLVAGGDPDWVPSALAILYRPATGTFADTGSMSTPRDYETATLLPDGTVLVAGGQMIGGQLASAELYDPASGRFTRTGDMLSRRCCHTATLLNDGRVLMVGGFPGSSAELYHPVVMKPAPVLFSISGIGQGQGAILHAGTGQPAAPGNPAIVGEALEIYLTGLADGSIVPPRVSIGGRLAETLFFGPAPGLPGVNQVNVRVPGGIATGDAVSVRMTYLGRHSNEVTIAVRDTI